MLPSVEQAFVGRDEKRASLKTPAWEAKLLLKRRELDKAGYFGGTVLFQCPHIAPGNV